MIYFTLEDLWDYYGLSLENGILLEHRDDNKFYKYLATREIINFIHDLEAKGQNPRDIAAYIGAYDIRIKERRFIICATSSKIPPPKINKILHDLSKPLGKIDEEGDNTTNKIGCCAEFNAVNELLNKGSNIKNIRLTRAYRYRGKFIEPILYCDNCKRIFSTTPYILDKENERTNKFLIL